MPKNALGISEPSPNKVKANRENALKSTGPKTLEGKERVRFNALKHGLLAKEIVIKEGDGKEDQGEFEALQAGLSDAYQTEGPLEEMILERIAVCYWRLHRAAQYETGVLREGLDTVFNDFYTQQGCKGELVNPKINYKTLKNEQRHIIKTNRRCIKHLKANLDIRKPFIGDNIDVSDYYWNLIEREYILEPWDGRSG